MRSRRAMMANAVCSASSTSPSSSPVAVIGQPRHRLLGTSDEHCPVRRQRFSGGRLRRSAGLARRAGWRRRPTRPTYRRSALRRPGSQPSSSAKASSTPTWKAWPTTPPAPRRGRPYLRAGRFHASILRGGGAHPALAALRCDRLPAQPAGMTVLVTGGAGYIGSHTVRALRDAGRDVVVLDSLELGDAEAPSSTRRSWSATSPTRRSSTRPVHDHGVTQIIHFAAYKTVGESMESAGKYWQNNVAGTVRPRRRRCSRPASRHRVLLVVLGLRHAADGPGHRGRSRSRPRASTPRRRRWSSGSSRWYGDDARPARRQPALLQRRRAPSFDGRIGEDWTRSINLIPLAMKAHCSATARRCRCSATTTRRPTAPASATTSTSTTSPTPTCRPSTTSRGGGATVAINVGTGVGTCVLDVIQRSNGSPAGRFRTRSSPGGPAIRWPPTPTRR